MVRERSVGLAIILSLITCGLYGLYWIYALTNEIGVLSGDRSFTGGKTLLLCIITCGIYTLFWYYQVGSQLMQVQSNYGEIPKDDSLLYLLLGIFGFGIVSIAIAQSNVNKLV